MVGDFGWEHEGTKSGVDTVNPLSTGGGFFLTPPIVNLTPFFCAWRKNFQLLMSFLFEDFNTSQSCQIFYLLVKILKNFPTKISNLPHF